MHEEKQVNIDEFIRLKDAYTNKHPNYKYKPKMKKHQPFNWSSTDMHYHSPFMKSLKYFL